MPIDTTFRVFKIKYERLETLSKSDDNDDIFEIVALIRHLCENGLIEVVANSFGLQHLYPIHTEYSNIGSRIFLRDFKPAAEAYNNINMQALLALRVIDSFRLTDVIDIVANTCGGVHHDVVNDNNPLFPLANKFFGEDDSSIYSSFQITQGVAKTILKGCLHIYEAVVFQKFSSLQQMKFNKQPMIALWPNGNAQFYFNDTYLEAYSKFSETTSVINLTFGLCYRENGINNGVIFSIGNRKSKQFIKISLKESELSLVHVHNYTDSIIATVTLLPDIFTPVCITLEKINQEISGKLSVLQNGNIQSTNGPIMSLSSLSNLSGKMCVGADINGKNSMEFEFGSLMIFHEYVNVQDLLIRVGRQLPVGFSANIQQGGYIMRVYNQTE